MGIPSYQVKQQYDSHECLCFLLDKFFLDNEESFKLQARQSTFCENTGCFHNSEGITYERTLTLNIEQTYDYQSINKILLRSMFRHHLPDYRCEGCQSVGFCYKTNSICHLPDILIITLSFFKPVTDGFLQKFIPNLIINDSISLYGKNLDLFGIVYYSGQTMNSGHYTSALNLNGASYTINDDQISKGARLISLSSNGTVPYILICKNIITQHRIEVNPSRDSTIRLSDNYGVSSETCFNLSKSSSLN